MPRPRLQLIREKLRGNYGLQCIEGALDGPLLLFPQNGGITGE